MPRNCSPLLATILLLILNSSAFSQSQLQEQAPEVEKTVTPEQAEQGQTDGNLFVVPEGFVVEKLFTVPKDDMGSWVNITRDPKGRLIVSDERDKGLFRVTPPEMNESGKVTVQKLDIPLSGAHGLLFAFDSLYVTRNGGGSGLYRVPYDVETDTFGEPELLHELRGAGEHGPHALRLSPDGESIYIVSGNHTRPPFDPKLTAEPQSLGGAREEVLHAELPENALSRLPANWDEDLLLTRLWDANGHARGVLAPGGWVAKTDPEGKTWEMIATGQRNTFDMDFNADGELFLYDSDMEWDMGSPWYRPTRILHAVSGADFGWRSGTGKWPEYYADSLPGTLRVGPGSPVGVTFGYGAKFPAEYQQAMFCLDWTFGTIYAIHLTPSGASYTATKDEFVSRNALPVTDAVVGQDGALYFTVGGRGTDSFLYRVRYEGDESTEPVDASNSEFADLRLLRRQLESTHTPSLEANAPNWRDLVDPASLDGQAAEDVAKRQLLIDHLSHDDRFIRYAARIGLEHIPVDHWSEVVFQGEGPRTQIYAAIALARQGDREDQAPLLEALRAIDFSNLDTEDQLAYLRALQLAFIRLGAPDETARLQWLDKLDPLYSADSYELNRELAQLLVFLNSRDVVQETLTLMQTPSGQTESDLGALLARNPGYGSSIRAMLENQPDKPRVDYAFILSQAREGWNNDLWKQFFDFLQTARDWSGGNSYRKFIVNIDNAAYEALPENERILIEASGARKPFVLPELPKPEGPGKEWTLTEVRELAKTKLKDRSFRNGEEMYAAAHCVLCHRFAGDGGATGPDLTQLAGRFNIDALTEAIIEPSKVISDQYRAFTIATAEGEVINGRIVSETDSQITVVTDPEDSTKVVDLQKGQIEAMKPSDVSLMPSGLLNTMNEDEVLDLVAYLLSRGNPNDSMFRRERRRR